jgi:geranylgeranyl pyrophosphate synthase
MTIQGERKPAKRAMPAERETLEKIEELKRIVNTCHQEFLNERGFDPELTGMIEAANRIFMSDKAKRIRAVIPMLIAEEGFCEIESVKRYAVLIELLHFSSLVHDDVIDVADERRDQPSLNALFANANAVLIGDHFICESIEYALRTRNNTAVIAVSVDAVKKLITGVMMEQRLSTGDFDFETYRKMAEMKTGCLFGLSFGLPFVGTASCDLGLRTGTKFGLLFQIYDDYLDRSEDHAAYNIYKAMSSEAVSEKCHLIFRELLEDCRELGVENSLWQVVIYLKSHGYFFDVDLPRFDNDSENR